MHVLDLIMFIILTLIVARVLFFFYDEIYDGLGEKSFVALFTLWVVVYFIIFVVYDNNWVDIFEQLQF